MLPLSMILAVSTNRVIGKAGTLPWRFSEDLKYFKRVTSASVPPAERAVIMGRKTHQSIGRALPKRHNIVITRTPTQPMQTIIAPDCSVASSLKEAIDVARIIDTEPVIIGGASLYVEALPLATRLYVTTVHAEYEGDVFMPENFPAVTMAGGNVSMNAPGWRIVDHRVSADKDALTDKMVDLSWVTMVRV